LKRAGLPGLHVYYDAWQRRSGTARPPSQLRRCPSRDLRHLLDARRGEPTGQALCVGPGRRRC
jgi:hypothetical protein